MPASFACHAGLDPASMPSWIAGQARNDRGLLPGLKGDLSCRA
jgi:hypothetical protein